MSDENDPTGPRLRLPIPVRDSETRVIKYERSPALDVVQPRSSMLCAPNCPSRGLFIGNMPAPGVNLRALQ